MVDAVHKRLARNDVLGLKIPYSPKYHEVTLDFTDYAASILHPEKLAADRGAKDTGPRVGVLHASGQKMTGKFSSHFPFFSSVPSWCPTLKLNIPMDSA